MSLKSLRRRLSKLEDKQFKKGALTKYRLEKMNGAEIESLLAERKKLTDRELDLFTDGFDPVNMTDEELNAILLTLAD